MLSALMEPWPHTPGLALRMRCSKCGNKAAEVVAVARPRPRCIPKNPPLKKGRPMAALSLRCGSSQAAFAILGLHTGSSSETRYDVLKGLLALATACAFFCCFDSSFSDAPRLRPGAAGRGDWLLRCYGVDALFRGILDLSGAWVGTTSWRRTFHRPGCRVAWCHVGDDKLPAAVHLSES